MSTKAVSIRDKIFQFRFQTFKKLDCMRGPCLFAGNFVTTFTSPYNNCDSQNLILIKDLDTLVKEK
jgi:hypothetical protein